LKVGLGNFKSVVLSQGIQGRHERVSLLTSLSLSDDVLGAIIASPHVLRRLTVRKHNIGDESRSPGQSQQLIDHPGTLDVVERADAIDTHQRALGIGIGSSTDEMSSAIGPSTGAKGILEGSSRLVKLLAELPGQRLAHNPAKGIAGHYAPDSTTVLAKSHHTAKRQGLSNTRGNLSAGVLLGNKRLQLQSTLVIQSHLQHLKRGAGQGSRGAFGGSAESVSPNLAVELDRHTRLVGAGLLGHRRGRGRWPAGWVSELTKRIGIPRGQRPRAQALASFGKSPALDQGIGPLQLLSALLLYAVLPVLPIPHLTLGGSSSSLLEKLGPTALLEAFEPEIELLLAHVPLHRSAAQKHTPHEDQKLPGSLLLHG